jgi:hypothetical protein
LAPLTALQLNVGVVETPVDPFEGELSVGAGNSDVCVVKDHCGENSPFLVTVVPDSE